jgi:hypothetical protein
VYGKTATDTFTGTTYPAFNWAKSLSIGGFTDWYIPATNEFLILYFFLKPDTTANSTSYGSNPYSVAPYTPSTPYAPGFPNQTTSAAFQSGGAEAFSLGNSYWTATEFSGNTNNAWAQAFSNGSQFSGGNKTGGQWARAIRRVAA